MPRIGADLSQVTDEDMDSTGGWRALENGEYRFKITQSEYNPTAKKNGMCLHLYVQCIEPGHERSRWREFLTLEHPNPDTVRIARAKLKQIAVAVGHEKPDFVEYSEDLHDIPFIAVVYRELADDAKYGDLDGYQNRINAYKPIQGELPRTLTKEEFENDPAPDADIPF